MNAREFAVNVYRAVDSMDPPAQLAFFTPDCTFVFANHAPVRGHEAIGAYVQAFFSTIAGLEHELFEVWSVGDNVIVRMTVTYTRKDGKRMTFPAAVIWCPGNMALPLDPAPAVPAFGHEVLPDAIHDLEERVEIGRREMRDRPIDHCLHVRDHLVAQSASLGRQVDGHSASVVRVAHSLHETVLFHVVQRGHGSIGMNADLVAQFALS
jgi:ketosteroid isomerase-like protein